MRIAVIGVDTLTGAHNSRIFLRSQPVTEEHMKITPDAKFAVIAYRDQIGTANVSSVDGSCCVVSSAGQSVTFTTYDERNDAYVRGPADGSYLEILRVIGCSDRIEGLREIDRTKRVDLRHLHIVAPDIRSELGLANIHPETRSYLCHLLDTFNMGTFAHPFLEAAGFDSAAALRMAVKHVVDASPQPPVDNDSEAECMADLKAALADTVMAIDHIERRLNAMGLSPAWLRNMDDAANLLNDTNATLDRYRRSQLSRKPSV